MRSIFFETKTEICSYFLKFEEKFWVFVRKNIKNIKILKTDFDFVISVPKNGLLSIFIKIGACWKFEFPYIACKLRVVSGSIKWTPIATKLLSWTFTRKGKKHRSLWFLTSVWQETPGTIGLMYTYCKVVARDGKRTIKCFLNVRVMVRVMLIWCPSELSEQLCPPYYWTEFWLESKSVWNA